MLVCETVGSKFELQMRYYISVYLTNTLQKGMNSFIPPAMV